MGPKPRACLVLEFTADGMVESWPRGDVHFLREALRNLAGALLTDPADLDQTAGATDTFDLEETA